MGFSSVACVSKFKLYGMAHAEMSPDLFHHGTTWPHPFSFGEQCAPPQTMVGKSLGVVAGGDPHPNGSWHTFKVLELEPGLYA